MSNELLSRFSDCNTLTDIYSVARTLRAENEISNQEINALVTQAKKMIMSKMDSTGYRRIDKLAIPSVPVSEVPITQFMLNVSHINEPVVTIKEDGTIIL